MLHWAKRLFTARIFDDAERTVQAALLTPVIAVTLAVAVVCAPFLLLLSNSTEIPRIALVVAATVVVGVFLLAAVRRGNVRLASVWLPAIYWVILTLNLIAVGGVPHPSMIAYPLVIALAGLLLGRWAALAYSALTAAAMGALLYAQAVGWIAPPTEAPLVRSLIEYVAVFAIGGVFTYSWAAGLRDALVQSRRVRWTERERTLTEHLAIERKRSRQMELLADVARDLTHLDRPDRLMDEAVRCLVQDFGYETASVLLVEGDHLVEKAAFGSHSAQSAADNQVALGHGIIGWVAATGQPHSANDTRLDSRFVPLPGASTLAELAVPMRLGKSVIGVLNIDSSQPGIFDAVDAGTVQSLADLLAASLQSSGLLVELQARERLAEALRRVGSAVTASLNLNTVLETICTESCAAFQADGASVWLVEGDEMCIAAVHGLVPEAMLRVRLHVSDPVLIAARAVRERRPVLDNDLAQSGQGLPQLRQMSSARSLLAAPILNEDQTIGALTIWDANQSNHFTERDVAAVQLLGAQLAVAIHNARLYSESRRRAGQLALINELAQHMTGLLQLRELCQAVANRLNEVQAFQSVGIFSVDVPARQVVLQGIAGPLASRLQAGVHRLAFGQGLVGEAAAAGLPQLSAHDPANTNGARAGDRAVLSELAIPLKVGERVVGVLFTNRPAVDGFAEDDEVMLATVGSQLALAIEKARLFEETSRRAHTLAGLYETALVTSSVLEVRPLLRRLADQIQNMLQPDALGVILYHPDRDALEVALATEAGQLLDALENTQLPLGEGGLTGWVIRNRQSLLVRDLDTEVLPAEPRHLAGSARSWLGVPMIARDVVLGIITVQSYTAGAFDEDDHSLVVSLSGQAAIALENAQLYYSVQQQAAEIGALYRASAALLNPGVTVADVAQRIVETMTREFEVSHGDVRLLNDATGALSLAAQAGNFKVTCPPLQFDGPGVVASAARSGKPVYYPDVTQAPSYVAGYSLTRSEFAVPLFGSDRLIGVLNLESPKLNAFTESARRILTAFSERAALALENGRLVESERRRAGQLNLLYELSRELAGTFEPMVIFRKTTDALVKRFGFAEATIMLPAGGGELELAYTDFTEEMGVRPGFRQKIGAGVIGQAALTRKTYVANDVAGDPHYFNPAGRGHGSALAIPLVRDQGLQAVLYIESSSVGAFSPPDIQALETLASHVGTALESARLYRSVSERLREMTALQSISQAVVSTLDVNQILQSVVLLLHNLFNYQFATLALLEGDTLRLAAQVGYDRPQVNPLLPIAKGIGGRAARTGRPQFVRDVSTDPDYVLGSPVVESEIAVPLMKDQEVLGIIDVGCGPDRPLTETDVNLLLTFAGQVTVALENARLFQAEREQRELAEALQASGATLASSLSFEAVLDLVLTHIERVVPYDSACVLEVRASVARPTRLRGYERFGGHASAADQVLVVETTPILLEMVRTGQPRVVPDTAADPDWVTSPGAAHIKSWVGAPIVVSGQIVAFFSLDKAEPGFYRAAQAERLAAFAGHASLALQNARLFEDIERRAAELEAVRQAGLTLTSSLDPGQVLKAILNSTFRLFQGLGNAHIFLYRDGQLTFGAAQWGDEGQNTPWAVPRPHGLTYTVARTGQAIVVPDMRSHPLFANTTTDWRGAIVGLPLKIGTRVVGVMNASYTYPREFSDSELRLLRLLGDQAAIAIENGRLYQAEREQRRLAEALRDAARALNSTLDLRNILDRLLEELAQLISFDSAAVFMGEAEHYRLVSGRGISQPGGVGNLLVPGGDALLSEVSRRRRPLLIEDARADPRFKGYGGSDFTRGWIGVPLVSRDAVLGAMTIDSRQPGAYSDHEADIAFAFAGQAAIAVENARLYEDLQARAEMLSALNATVLDISIPYELPVVLNTVVERAARLLHAPSGGLYLCEAERAEVRCVVAYNTAWDKAGVVLKYGDGAAGRVAQTGQPLIVDDYRAWTGRAQVFDSGQPSVALISVPMFWLGKVTGVIHVQDDTGRRRFDENDLEPLSQFARQAAVAVENARLLAETRRRADEQRLLFDAARDFAAGLDEEGVLQAVAGHMTAALRVSDCIVSRWEPASNTFVTLLDHDVSDNPEPEPHGTRHSLERFPATLAVLTSRRPLVVRRGDSAADLAERQLLEQHGFETSLIVPVAVGEAVFGTIELFRQPAEGSFTEDDTKLAQSLAAQAAGALENARLHSTVSERARELDALLTANAALLSTLDLDPLLRNVLAAAMEAIPPAEKGTILLVDPASGRLAVRAQVGYTDHRVRNLQFAGEGGYSAQAVREKRPLLIADARADPATRYEGNIEEVSGIRSAVAAPLMRQALPSGVISLDSTRVSAFADADLRLLVAFANTASAAIEHARLHAEVQTLAITDSITGLTNRREFDRSLEVELSRAVRYAYPLSLIILDIDDFKKYNDTFGHPAGDTRLLAIARLLRENVRDPDLAARYGGEEFALILPHTDKTGALALAERVRAAAEGASPQRALSGMPMAGYTVSLGVATYPDDASSAVTLLRAADDAELAAKRGGKNRVCAAL
jgi:diguanylate cyclase (GGDEF)-like protein